MRNALDVAEDLVGDPDALQSLIARRGHRGEVAVTT